ncbi:hypothetical protein [Streptomyces yunnanensis]|uniref:hypothetical protein n=1 Tax=Streptomyces yunnanensis TaxID=156453 RepID=UPI003B836902
MTGRRTPSGHREYDAEDVRRLRAGRGALCGRRGGGPAPAGRTGRPYRAVVPVAGALGGAPGGVRRVAGLGGGGGLAQRVSPRARTSIDRLISASGLAA